MMTLQQRKDAFVQLGQGLRALALHDEWPGYSSALTREEFEGLRELLDTARARNGWFTPGSVKQALAAWGDNLSTDKLGTWLSAYDLPGTNPAPATVALICAGNIPLVGFHDLLSVLITGNKALVKLSTDDDLLIPAVIRLLMRIEPGFAGSVNYASGVLQEFDAVIATGSTNTARYFREYFGAWPHIIRHGRTSVAILTGDESAEELAGLGHDIFDYFGLGCRSVSKIYVPEKYDLNTFFGGIYPFHNVINHNKYANNYDYNKAVWLLNQEELLDNGFILLKEEHRLASPTASLYYSRYNDRSELDQQLDQASASVQCVVARNRVPFGQAQAPGLADYADGADTIDFLLTIRKT